MKKVIFLLACLCYQVSIWSYDFQANNFNFNFKGNSDNVTLCSQITPTSTVVIPSKVSFRGREFNVTEIGDNAFRNANITEVKFCEGLLSIGDNAFRNTNIKEVVFPDSHQGLGDYAFADCPNLTYIEFGKGLITSEGFRPTLKYTFVNDDNIEKIVFRGNQPPTNFLCVPFSKMTRQFCKIYVPFNAYYNFNNEHTPWKMFFTNEIIPYHPKGEKTEIVPYCVYYWDNSKVTNKYEIKGSRSVDLGYDYYRHARNIEVHHMSLIIEECPDQYDSIMIRIKYESKLSGDTRGTSNTYYSYSSKDADYTNLNGESWETNDPDNPRKSKISFNFKKVKIKKPGLFKDKYEYKNGVEITFYGYKENVSTTTYIIDSIPENFNVKFEE